MSNVIHFPTASTSVEDRLNLMIEDTKKHGFDGCIVVVRNSATGLWGFTWCGELNATTALGLLEIAKSEILEDME